MKPRILVTAGDPLGIGPEIVVKALASPRARAAADFTAIGDSRALKKAGLRDTLSRVLPVDALRLDFNRRAPSAEAGLASFKAVKLALKLLKTGGFDALVTAPVSKEAWKQAGAGHTGHTGLFRSDTGREPLMAFVLGKAKAALATEHLALKNVPGSITKKLITAKAALFYVALARLGIARPRVVIAALNPHSGDGGLLGSEEIRILKPAVEYLRRKGFAAAGPAPTGAAWAAHLKGLYDGILCLYHDQALGPLKALPGAAGAVHVTWGLPFIRTSPAHGTAFDIAGSGTADPSGMIEAIAFAARLAGKAEGLT